MKLFATSHDHGYYRLTFMGLTLFERDAVSQVDVVHQKILGGLFSSRKENNISTGFREKIFALCGLPVCIRREGEFGREYSLAGLIIKRETWSQLLSKSSLMRSAHDANHIFLFKANSGEVFLFLRFIVVLSCFFL